MITMLLPVNGGVCVSAKHAVTAYFDQIGQIRRFQMCLLGFVMRYRCVLCTFVHFHFVTCSTWHLKIGAMHVFQN